MNYPLKINFHEDDANGDYLEKESPRDPPTQKKNQIISHSKVLIGR